MLLVELKGSIVTRESTLALMSPEMRSNVEARVTASLAIQICSHLRSGQPHFAVIALKQMSVSDGIRTMDALRPEEAAEVLGAHLHNHEWHASPSVHNIYNRNLNACLFLSSSSPY